MSCVKDTLTEVEEPWSDSFLVGKSIQMFCPFGVFDEIIVVSVGETGMSCTDFENLRSEESNCNMAKYFEDAFDEAECEGNTNC